MDVPRTKKNKSTTIETISPDSNLHIFIFIRTTDSEKKGNQNRYRRIVSNYLFERFNDEGSLARSD